MKNITFILLLLSVFSLSAQLTFNTGSSQLDADLNAINTHASTDFQSFKGDLAVSYDISENKIHVMRASLGMAAGEIYFALEISRIARTPIDTVITLYKNHKSKGWGYIAKQAGIKPGSPEFHQLKNNASTKKKRGNNNSKGNAKSKAKKKGKGKN
ncbi:hypothetical protein [Aquimarina brevivitae]|uniref:Uncharacterized protein n=1 Tax=Aquimarina brevivitae TaxID=323412 RepID=A0A4Q7P2F1_9FLAO|nr:hypothetical protein [Aquimarina brevivitae]RZS93560.1 hypothetical protein EV197_2140 [Aquimarina brevivitae]